MNKDALEDEAAKVEVITLKASEGSVSTSADGAIVSLDPDEGTVTTVTAEGVRTAPMPAGEEDWAPAAGM